MDNMNRESNNIDIERKDENSLNNDSVETEATEDVISQSEWKMKK